MCVCVWRVCGEAPLMMGACGKNWRRKASLTSSRQLGCEKSSSSMSAWRSRRFISRSVEMYVGQRRRVEAVSHLGGEAVLVEEAPELGAIALLAHGDAALAQARQGWHGTVSDGRSREFMIMMIESK